jgi:hypothetical protein
MKIESGDKLEKIVNELLRAQPPRRAPLNLERRVMSELRRQALPWWQQSFLYWPLLARAALVVACALVARLCLGISMWLGGGSRLLATPSALVRPAEWTHRILDVAAGTRDLGLVVLHAIPSTWLIAVLGVAAVFYAVFFGLCATAYRMLFAQPAFQR